MKKNILIAAIMMASVVSFAKEKTTTTKEVIKNQDVTGQIKWTGYGVGKSHDGTVQLKSGSIEMKNDMVTGGTFVFDMASLNSTKFDYSEKLTGHLKSADFFNVEKFNTATLKITKVSALKSGANAFEMTGDLTIKDKTNPITFNAVITKDGAKLKAAGSVEIKDRTKYDIVYNSKQFSALSKLGDKLIEDNIKIDIDVMTK